MKEIKKNINQSIDELEAKMREYPAVDCPLHHLFTPGLYTREVTMPVGALVTSRIHKQTHPFSILKGVAHVKVNDQEWKKLQAPFIGVTQAGTRRVLYIEEECVWATYHPTDVMPEENTQQSVMDAVAKVEEQIYEKHINKILGGEIKNNVLTKIIE